MRQSPTTVVDTDLTIRFEAPRRAPDWRSTLPVVLCASDAFLGSAAAWLFLVITGQGANAPLAGVLSCVLLWSAAAWLFGGDDPEGLAERSDAMRPVVLAAAVFVLPVLALAFLLTGGWLVVVLAACTGASLGTRVAASRFVLSQRAAGNWRRRVVVIGTEPQVREFVRLIDEDDAAALEVVGVSLVGSARSMPLIRRGLPVFAQDAGIVEVASMVRADAAVMIASDLVDSDFIACRSRSLHEAGLLVLLAGPIHRTTLREDDSVLLPVAAVAASHVRGTVPGVQRLLKEVIDRGGAAVLLLVLSPLIVGIALAVRLTSEGGAFFRQARVGLGGRTFTMYKFRSMRHDAEAGLSVLRASNEVPGALLFKMRSDPRVTRVGAWLRRTSLDELPQLINVVRGNMSLVGPRPALPSEVARYPEPAWRRLLVKPGMTGLWQISGRSDLPSSEGVLLDLRYVDTWSLGLDASILLKTVQVVTAGSGAY